MNDVSVLIVVDALGAEASGSLDDNVYLVDTNQYLGSWREGRNDLHTVCQEGQTVTWTVSAVAAGVEVAISGFTGDMVTTGVCVPTAQGLGVAPAWSGLVETRGLVEDCAYGVTLTADGTPMTFSADLKVV